MGSLNLIFSILSIYSIAFSIKEASLLDKPRDYLIRNSPFFYKLLSCYYCTATHAGYLAYLLLTPIQQYHWRGFLLWTLAGGPIGLIFNGLVNKLYREQL